jgi:hypothetical protein
MGPPSTHVNGDIMRHWSTAVVLLLLVGCSATAPDETQTAPATTDERAGSTPLDEGLPTAPPPMPTWDQESTQRATQVALDATRAYCRPTLDDEVWFEELAGFLTAAGQEAHYGTDPAEVACSEVAGTSMAGDSTTAYLATVAVITNAGPYEVLLSRVGAGEPWLVERISPPS